MAGFVLLVNLSHTSRDGSLLKKQVSTGSVGCILHAVAAVTNNSKDVIAEHALS